jgi:NAD(P)-dependent dehydrogenase (short-subunit alcohol dehydrogenase family)
MSKPVVLVTGALAGIGRATALAFAAEGARLVLAGRRDEEGQAFEGDLREAGVEAVYVRADVRREEDVRRLIERAVERFSRLDVAVNCAGAEGTPGPVETEMLKRLTPTTEKVAAMVAGVPLKRVGQVDEIARAILFISSDKANFITGNILWVDGGKSAG